MKANQSKSEYPAVINNQLVVVLCTGSQINIGIRVARQQIKQIKASTTQLKDSTKLRLKTLEDGVQLWESQKNG